LEDEIADLQAELDLAHAVHDALVEDLDALQAELEQAYVRMGQLRVESDVTSANELRDALAMEAAAANILLGLGNSAVSPLMDALSHENPIVRRWAASVLGGMGSAAEEAVPALTEMLMDSDVDVQRAAQAALDAIER
jgi:HEAT repeat protein